MSLSVKDVSVLTSSGILRGWLDVDVNMSIEQASNTFAVKASDYRVVPLWDHPAKLDSPCRVLFGDTPVINGYIEQLNPDYDADNHTISVSGRDVTCDLIDSSAIMPKQEMRNITIKTAAEMLCAPHGVKVNCPKPGDPFDVYAINDGESVFDSLEQHARQRQLLMYTLADGVLHIKKAEPIPINVVLKEGDNILRASAEHQSTQQFGKYVVKSQKEKGKTQIRQDVRGTHPRQNRILILRPEKPNDDPECKDRGQWEKKVRKARGRRATITVNSWEWRAGQLWRPLLLPMLDSPRLGFRMPMVVASVRLHVDDSGGALATLELVDPDVYT